MPMNQVFSAQWMAAGYDADMGSAGVVPPPPKEFIRAYHVTSATFAISSITLRRMKVARFSDLNDPFELMAVTHRSKKNRRILKDWKSQYNNNTGLLCFSANWTDPVLWSHYGDKHRGICLGFNLKRADTEKVQYEDSRILPGIGERGDPFKLSDELQMLLRRTKYHHWKYEKEIRVFVRLHEVDADGDLYFRSFCEEFDLTEVILGPECTLPLDETRQLVQSLFPRAVTFKARLAFKSFKVVPQKRTVPSQ